MALQQDYQWQFSRLLGDETSEYINLSVGELIGFSQGAWLLDGDDTVVGTNDHEMILGNRGLDVFLGEGGNDSLFGGKENDYLAGNSGDDLVSGERDNDSLYGNDGNDLIRGGKGDDLINGEAGNDTLYGDIGTDIILGGSGADLFVLRPGLGQPTIDSIDEIGDFQSGEDHLSLSEGLQFTDIDIYADPNNPNDTIIQEKSTGLYLARVKNVSQITVDDILRPGQLSFSASQYFANEAYPSFDVTINRTNGSDGELTADLSAWGVEQRRDATLDKDYQLPVTSVTFADGDTSPQTITLPLINDNIPEYPELLQLNLNDGNQGANLTNPAIATVEIFDNETFGFAKQVVTMPEGYGFPYSFGYTLVPMADKLAIGTPRTYSSYVGRVFLYDPQTQEFLQTFINPATANDIPSPEWMDSYRNIFDDRFGYAIAPMGNNLLIGAPGVEQDNKYQVGKVFLFNTETSELIKTFNYPLPLTEGNINPEFGASIAVLNNNQIVIGAPAEYDETNSGSAYLFNGDTGELKLQLSNPNPAVSDFGQTIVSFNNGNDILIGAPADGLDYDSVYPTHPGKVYLFDGDTGELLRTFSSPDATTPDSFGRSIITNGDQILIGAPGDDSQGDDSGKAYLFDGLTGDLLRTFTSPEPDQKDFFGEQVATVGDEFLISSPFYSKDNIRWLEAITGAVFRFDSTDGSLTETYLSPLDNPNTSFPRFGMDVTSINSHVVISADNFSPPYYDSEPTIYLY